MIKETKKTKNTKKTLLQSIEEYFRTIFYSIIVAAIITSGIAIHAKNEMIKNLYSSVEEQSNLDRALAKKIIGQSDLIKDLKTKSYSVCMHVGDLYRAAEDYKNAQYAYETALKKAKPNAIIPYYKLLYVLVEQEKFEDANKLLAHFKGKNNKAGLKFKTRSYIVMGDKYYSIGKFLSAAKCYEKADFYYSTFTRNDKQIDTSIKNRIVNAYSQVSDVMVKSGLNSEGVRFLKKAEKYAPNNFNIKYKLAIILSDSDPEKAVEYIEPLLDKFPQDIDYSVYNNALLKAANIAELDNRPTQAKYYRYKIHSIDMFINRKVVYKNDINIKLQTFCAKKKFFTYPISAKYIFSNNSNMDIVNLMADFELISNDKIIDAEHAIIADKNNPLYSYSDENKIVDVKFKKIILSKKDLANYSIKIYLYKDPKFRTLVYNSKVPNNSF
jgi:tetratricopeptide (TPR) repeat protein